MDSVTRCHRLKTALPKLLLAGVLGLSAGCAHHQGMDAGEHHPDMNAGARHGSHHDAHQAPAPAVEAVGAQRLAEEMGIELVSLRTTAGGHMLDLRYRVVDPEKAYEVLREASKINIVIVDRAHDVVAHVPSDHKGWLRAKAGKARTDQVYFVILANPHQMIRPGGTVDIHVGDVAVVDWPVL